MTEGTSLLGKRVLVTGGTTGIGRSVVHRLAAEGARVLTFGRDESALKVMLAEAPDSSGHVIGMIADVTSRQDLSSVFCAVDARLGGLDMLVCCAALGADPIAEMLDDDWRYAVETNLVGYLAYARARLIDYVRSAAISYSSAWSLL
jgi:NAD(P)-dependent dehydrogenase (short-subunit alcohol dehydrogenase family)